MVRGHREHGEENEEEMEAGLNKKTEDISLHAGHPVPTGCLLLLFSLIW